MMQKIWAQLSPDGIEVHLKFNEEVLERILQDQTNDTTGRKVLLLLDDVGSSVLEDKEARSVFHKLCTNGRHMRLSIVFLSQKMAGQIPTVIRSNTDCAIFFGATSFREQEAAYSEFAMVNKKSFTEMFRSATAERHSTLTCVMKEGRLHYYHNLENELFPS